MAVYVDAEPTLIYTGSLREYTSPQDAIAGLYKRWLIVREPMLLLSVSHPSAEVQTLAFHGQAQLEMVLRLTDDAIKSKGSLDQARRIYDECGEKLTRLGKLLSAFTR